MRRDNAGRVTLYVAGDQARSIVHGRQGLFQCRLGGEKACRLRMGLACGAGTCISLPTHVGAAQVQDGTHTPRCSNFLVVFLLVLFVGDGNFAPTAAPLSSIEFARLKDCSCILLVIAAWQGRWTISEVGKATEPARLTNGGARNSAGAGRHVDFKAVHALQPPVPRFAPHSTGTTNNAMRAPNEVIRNPKASYSSKVSLLG